MTNKQATEAPERQRTPEQIIGNDAFTQLIFEGYEIVSSGELATARQAGIDEGLEMAAQKAEVYLTALMTADTVAGRMLHRLDGDAIRELSAAIRALKSENENG